MQWEYKKKKKKKNTCQIQLFQKSGSLINLRFWRRNGNPLQYSCLENPVDRAAWWAAVYGVAQSETTEAT